MQIRETAARAIEYKYAGVANEIKKPGNVKEWKTGGKFILAAVSRVRHSIKGNECSKTNQDQNPIWPRSCYWNGICSCLLRRACTSTSTKGFSPPVDSFPEAEEGERSRTKKAPRQRLHAASTDELFSGGPATLTTKQTALCTGKIWKIERDGISWMNVKAYARWQASIAYQQKNRENETAEQSSPDWKCVLWSNLRSRRKLYFAAFIITFF